MSRVLKVENISKQYRLGNVGTGTLKDDVKRWWYGIRGKSDPLLSLGEVNDRTSKGDSDYVWALKDITFDVQQGDVLGIIGRNGAGKSTLLKILSKTTAPTKGIIKVKGRIASLLEVGTGFHPELTGRENIYLNGAILGMGKYEITRKLEEIIDFAGVDRYIDTPVKRYSSGMYVRLAFSVAAHLESEILVVDEVLAVGDAEFQKKCLGKMNNISKGEGRTVLFVSHSMAAITNLCNRCLYLNNGQVEAIGSMSTIINEYVSKGRINRAEINESEIVYSNRCEQAYFNTIKIKMDDEVTDSVSISKDVVIEAEFTITENNIKVFPSFHLLDNLGTCIFASFNAPSASIFPDKYFGVPLKTGKYVTRMTIPANFLNEANYKISAFLVPNETSNMSMAQEVLEFRVVDTGEMRKEYTGDWIGQIRPKLDWKTEFLG